ncbi:MOSC domain-containing protein [Corallincola holothuriorum]|uniref:MOSC domain-containing protein n=1 Tax=Corallincola holothuriorum TaxID=2282215 RepID=A0A368NQ64_9GAMM|nr:MOSC N-terminal beta barrel domain-containing protein [Corallincola holothuriorum]RCU51824.1 MOSC domain-containing protein [Corallincola holothuriorum]
MSCVVTHLYIYPVKSLAGISLTEAQLSVEGLQYDRQWMLVDSKGRFVTQRQCPALAAIKTAIEPEQLLLSAEGHEPFSIPLKRTTHVPLPLMDVTVWKDQVEATDEGDSVSQWLAKVLGTQWPRPLRLVRFAEQAQRPVSQSHLRQGESANTHFADGYPYLLANQASLEVFNNVLAAQGLPTIPMSRFRPNIIVTGWSAFQENHVSEVSHDDYSLALRKPCERCPMITVDQQSGKRQEPTGQPLRALTEMATLGDVKAGAFFGQNAILVDGVSKTIKVGDQWQYQAK